MLGTGWPESPLWHFPQTCTSDKDQATFNLKLALKLSGALDRTTTGSMFDFKGSIRQIARCCRSPALGPHIPSHAPPAFHLYALTCPVPLQARAASWPRRWTS